MKALQGKPGLLLMLQFALVSPSMADSNTEFIDAIPDFTQSRIAEPAYAYGAELCAPVAVSNSLSWMTNTRSRQAELVKLLASRDYMNTDIHRGTRTSDFLDGVHAIAMDLFGGYRSLEYQGWKKHPARFSTGAKIPDIGWITEGMNQNSAVWLNVGWYRYDHRHNIYHRVGGHWVTLAGYDGDVLIIHDPAPRAGLSFANEYVQTSLIQGGYLADRNTGFYRPATGYLLLGQGMHIKSIADAAIIDGAIRYRK
jgi:hypothetical protein